MKLGSNYPKPSLPSRLKVTFFVCPAQYALVHSLCASSEQASSGSLWWMNVHLKKMAQDDDDDDDASGSDRSRNMWLNIWYCNIHICVFLPRYKMLKGIRKTVKGRCLKECYSSVASCCGCYNPRLGRM